MIIIKKNSITLTILNKIIDFARQELSNEFPSHDFSHTERVVLISRHLAEVEGADEQIVVISAWLHDCARKEEEEAITNHNEKDADHAVLGSLKAEKLLQTLQFDTSTINAVTHAIRTHRYRKIDPNSKPQTLEAKILYDADKLDSIGAIGVARAYSYAGEQGYRLYSDVPSDYPLRAYKDPKKHTPVIEFEVKLRHVMKTLFTKTAKAIAQSRHEFIVNFFSQLEKEVKGLDIH